MGRTQRRWPLACKQYGNLFLLPPPADGLSTFASSILARQGDHDKTLAAIFSIQMLHHFLEDDFDVEVVESSSSRS